MKLGIPKSLIEKIVDNVIVEGVCDNLSTLKGKIRYVMPFADKFLVCLEKPAR